jgi:hypothetical protein
MLSYIIQTLSAEHAFGLQLTFPIKSAYIPTKWNVGGATADFFINVRVFLVFMEVLVTTTCTGRLLHHHNNFGLLELDVSSIDHCPFQFGTLFQILEC